MSSTFDFFNARIVTAGANQFEFNGALHADWANGRVAVEAVNFRAVRKGVAAGPTGLMVGLEPPRKRLPRFCFQWTHELATFDFSLTESRSISFEKRLSLPSLVSS